MAPPVRIILLVQHWPDPSEAQRNKVHPVHIKRLLAHPKEPKHGDRRQHRRKAIIHRRPVKGLARQQDDRVPRHPSQLAVVDGGEVEGVEGKEVAHVVDEVEEHEGEVGNEDGERHEVEAALGAAGARGGAAVGGGEGGDGVSGKLSEAPEGDACGSLVLVSFNLVGVFGAIPVNCPSPLPVGKDGDKAVTEWKRNIPA